MRYFDSGVLLKLYLSEPNSAQAVALVQEQGGLPPITALHRLEMKAAFGQKHGRGEIIETERDAVLASFENDLARVFSRGPFRLGLMSLQGRRTSQPPMRPPTYAARWTRSTSPSRWNSARRTFARFLLVPKLQLGHVPCPRSSSFVERGCKDRALSPLTAGRSGASQTSACPSWSLGTRECARSDARRGRGVAGRFPGR